jgi:hypothetical protein
MTASGSRPAEPAGQAGCWHRAQSHKHRDLRAHQPRRVVMAIGCSAGRVGLTRATPRPRWGLMSAGGLEPPRRWYIPELGIYHQFKLTRQGPPGLAFRKRIAQRRPGQHDQSDRLTCGNDESRSAGIELQSRTGLQHPHRGAPSSGRQGDSLPLPPGSSRSRRSPVHQPDDLAAELNPHKPELNPHKAVPAG